MFQGLGTHGYFQFFFRSRDELSSSVKGFPQRCFTTRTIAPITRGCFDTVVEVVAPAWSISSFSTLLCSSRQKAKTGLTVGA